MVPDLDYESINLGISIMNTRFKNCALVIKLNQFAFSQDIDLKSKCKRVIIMVSTHLIKYMKYALFIQLCCAYVLIVIILFQFTDFDF